MMSIAMALAGGRWARKNRPRDGAARHDVGGGTALGPSLGGALIAGFGWRAMFLINLPLGLLALWLARDTCRMGAHPAARQGTVRSRRYATAGRRILLFAGDDPRARQFRRAQRR